MLEKILRLKSNKIICKNQSIIDEIVKFISVEDGSGQLFLRHTTRPVDDLEVGFSASHFVQDPYVSTLDEALNLMRSEETEDNYFIFRHLSWNSSENHTESNLYKHHLKHPYSANTCPPVYDHRIGKAIVNPEFGLSAYLISDSNNVIHLINELISQCYMYNNSDLKNWHLFKAEFYHHGDSDSQKDNSSIPNSDRIVCMLNAEHIMSFQRLLELTITTTKTEQPDTTCSP